MKPILQGGETESRMAHNHEVGGATPPPATTLRGNALVAGQERERAADGVAVARVLAELEHAAAFLKSHYVETLIERAVGAAVERANSRWLDRQAAAAYCRCSLTELDRARKLGVFPEHLRAGTPLFLREDLDAAILKGHWPKR